VPGLLEDASNELPLTLRQLIDRLPHHLKELDRPVRELEREILVWHRNSDLSRKLEQIPGIGPLAATALVDGTLGLTPSARMAFCASRFSRARFRETVG